MEGEAGASLLCAVVHCQPRESIKTQQDGAAEGCNNLDHCTYTIIMAIPLCYNDIVMAKYSEVYIGRLAR